VPIVCEKQNDDSISEADTNMSQKAKQRKMEKFVGLIHEVQLSKLLNESVDDQLSYRKRMSIDMHSVRALSIGKPKYASINHYKNNRVT
jgi:hypothetical protein